MITHHITGWLSEWGDFLLPLLLLLEGKIDEEQIHSVPYRQDWKCAVKQYPN